MKEYRDDIGRRVLQIESLAFLYQRDGYNWLQRHWLNIRHKIAIRRAEIIMVPDPQTAYELEKYYFVPRETIVVETSRSAQNIRGNCRWNPFSVLCTYLRHKKPRL